MARTSRKDAIRARNAGQPVHQAVPASKPEPVYNAAGYARLSIMETRDRKDSEALQNQTALLREFIEKHPELRLCCIHEDNGETGTSFDRPGFGQLMQDARSGKISCIVVKDLSRFGRNHVEADYYIEHVFPHIGVRFISIADGYDSADPSTSDRLMVGLKNVFNQVYSADISRKSGAVLREKQRRGEFIGAYASYGYLKDPEDGHKIIPDPETAPIVQEMFRRKLEGMGNTAIARWLNDSGIPSPCNYRYQRGIILDARFSERKLWLVQTIKSILQNPVYLGHMVQGRRRSEFYAGRPDRMLPQSEWTVVENTHEAIIDGETFARVQEALKEKHARYHESLGKYDTLGKSENILKGLVYCADCGRTMTRYKQVSHGKKADYFYVCRTYAAQLESSGCTYKYLPEAALKEIVTQLISQEMRLAVDTATLLQKQAKEPGNVDAAQRLRLSNAELAKLEGLKKRLMQDYLAGQLTPAEYERMKKRYQQECEELSRQIEALNEAHQHEERVLSEKNPWLCAFSHRGASVELSRDLVQALVDRITVYTNQHIEVVFRFRDERQALFHLLQEVSQGVSA